MQRRGILDDSETESQCSQDTTTYITGAFIVIDKSVPLSSLIPGQSAHVRRISGQADHVHRLEEFGLRGGTRIQMFRPGNPCIVRLVGSKVCLRADDLLRILVEPDGASG